MPAELPCDDQNPCPLGLDDKFKECQQELQISTHMLGLMSGRVEALEQRTEEIYSKIILGKYQESLVTQVSKLVENAQEDRSKLEQLETKIEEYQKAQVQDLLEIKEAIHNLGLVGLLFKNNGGKLAIFIVAVIVGLISFDVWIFGKEASLEPRILKNEQALNQLIEIIKVRLDEDE